MAVDRVGSRRTKPGHQIISFNIVIVVKVLYTLLGVPICPEWHSKYTLCLVFHIEFYNFQFHIKLSMKNQDV